MNSQVPKEKWTEDSQYRIGREYLQQEQADNGGGSD